MFQFRPETIAFIEDLAANNSKVWMDANRKRYERELKQPAREFAAAINERLEGLAPEFVTPPNRALNRINRDIRFSKDKTPYNTHIWAAFVKNQGPREESPGIYVAIHLDRVVVGGGAYKPQRDRIDALRAHLADHHEELARILSELGDYGELRGEAYKRVPKPYPADHPAAEWLKLKGMHLMSELSSSLVTSPELVPTIAKEFERLLPFIRFTERGLAS